MHQTKVKPAKSVTGKKPRRPAPANGRKTPGEVLTLAEAAAYLRVTAADVLRLAREQGLPGRQVGTDWRFLKPALQDWLRGPRPKTNEAFLALAGASKGDPDLEE